ncbi:hypothetical protein Cme02nite_18590 [Catellatospora methionotrophica]|uniref:CBM2 domain-containing protein n=1 Tax=Catellatospora methionotrophica TaxID=121620 RepID=A0A8J3L2T3_9ACTN|nr:cellulose binding domain-containing protein [Catellatospora methionotrophica]GIG13527.1 hypothetical protein Cme02nite_18590 [Catellatospora methionotrophica]
MTVLRLDVELPYPVELVWLALTDRRLLGEWFLQTDLVPVQGGVYRAYPAGDLPGFTVPFDMDVIEVVGPTRLALRWRGEQLHADVVWELSTVAEGCRLRVSQTGFLGIAGQVRRVELRRAYATMFEQRLPALLARQELAAAAPSRRRRSRDIYDAADMPRRPAAAPVSRARQAAGPARSASGSRSRPPSVAYPGACPPPTAVLGSPVRDRGADEPAEPGFDAHHPDPADLIAEELDAAGPDVGDEDDPGPGGLLGRVFHMPVDRRLRLLSAAGAMVLTVLAVTAVATLLLRSPDPAAEPVDGARGPWSGVQAAESVTPSAAASPSPSVAPSLSVAPGASAAVPPSAAASAPSRPGPTEGAAVTVTYRTLETWNGGYIGEIAIRPNAALDGWSAKVTLPRGAAVTSAWDRIDFRQDGDRVTFTPQAVHRELPAGEEFTVAFQVGDPSGATRPESCAVEGVSCGKR